MACYQPKIRRWVGSVIRRCVIQADCKVPLLLCSIFSYMLKTVDPNLMGVVRGLVISLMGPHFLQFGALDLIECLAA